MPKIRSFTVDHDALDCGMYVSRVDGDIVTYDLRMRRPNNGDYLSDLAMHSF
ncbi:MAG: S-ribosylhomocysteine lyase, partial [Clostridia bacterium]|nr:S-ribosylhomocysteine lyase [Clostridia bacterium]